MIDRRAFLRRLGFGTVAAAAAASGVLDVERLLWVPGEKTIFVPPAPLPLTHSFNIGDVISIDGYFATNPRTGKPMEHLRQFVVTQEVSAGTILMVEQLTPSIITAGPYRNVSGPKPRPYGINGRDVKPLWAR